MMSDTNPASETHGSSQQARDCSTPTIHLNQITEIAPDQTKEPQHVAELRSLPSEQFEERMADEVIQEDTVDAEVDIVEGSLAADLIEKRLASQAEALKIKDASYSNTCIALVGPTSAGKSRLINSLLSVAPAEELLRENNAFDFHPWPFVRPISLPQGPLLRDNMSIFVDPPQYDSGQETRKTQDVKQLIRQRIKELEDLRRKKTNRSL